MAGAGGDTVIGMVEGPAAAGAGAGVGRGPMVVVLRGVPPASLKAHERPPSQPQQRPSVSLTRHAVALQAGAVSNDTPAVQAGAMVRCDASAGVAMFQLVPDVRAPLMLTQLLNCTESLVNLQVAAA